MHNVTVIFIIIF